MEIAEQFIEAGHPKKVVLSTVGISRSSYYYQPKTGGKKGRPYSHFTYTQSGSKIDNAAVVIQIEQLLSEEFVDYGYLKVCHWLRQEENYTINPKKVYRLMASAGLLNKFVARKKNKRNWVKHLLPPTKEAFDYLEFDIKYFYVAGKNRNALLLTVIDVKTRWVMAHYMAWEIKQKQVIVLFDQIFAIYPLPKHFHVRNDNGSQFEAKAVQDYFLQKKVTQEFCKPATPEQNAHIESYHSIVEKIICQRYEFENLIQLQEKLNKFVVFYDFKRIHSGVGYTSPYKYLLTLGIDMNKYDLNDPLDCSSKYLQT